MKTGLVKFMHARFGLSRRDLLILEAIAVAVFIFGCSSPANSEPNSKNKHAVGEGRHRTVPNKSMKGVGTLKFAAGRGVKGTNSWEADPEEDYEHWEWPIDSKQSSSYKKGCTSLSSHPGRYTPMHQCASVGISLLKGINVPIPNGVGPVKIPKSGLFPGYKKSLPNPWALRQQLWGQYGAPPTVTHGSYF